MYDYDVIFIGSGHSCNHAATALALAGKKVAFIEMDKIGGTCTNYGCDAKILLDGPFEYLEGLERYKGLCVDEVGTIDWGRLMAYKKEKIGLFDPMLAGLFTQMGIAVIRARGGLVDAHTEWRLRFESTTALLGHGSWQGFFLFTHYFLSKGHGWIILICRV